MPIALARRTLLAAAGAALAPDFARGAELEPVAWSDKPAFPDGPLAKTFGQNLRAPASTSHWPEPAPLMGPDGPLMLSSLRGRTLLVALWAEWCAPCLAEMPSLSRLNRAYGNARFEILPIATGTHELRTWRDAQERLRRMKGVDITTLLDGSPGRASLMNTLSHFTPPANFKLPSGAKLAKLTPGVEIASGTLPCLVVVDPEGRLRGRFQGGPGPGTGPNMWDQPSGEGFIKALADGALAA